MSPINDGITHLVTRRPVKGAALIHPRDEARLVALARLTTDFSYRAWSTETYGPNLVRAEAMARSDFMIPHLTETPVDRWMERLRG